MFELPFTIYHRQGTSPHHPDGAVGIAFPPTKTWSYSELDSLIDQLQRIKSDMRNTAEPVATQANQVVEIDNAPALPSAFTIAEFQYYMVQIWNTKEHYPDWQDARVVAKAVGGAFRETIVDRAYLAPYAADQGEMWLLNGQLVYILSEGTCVAEPDVDTPAVDNLTTLDAMHGRV